MVYEKTANDTLEYLSFVFKDKFHMDEIKVKHCLRTINHEDIASKFQLLESHGILEQADFNIATISELVASPLYRYTYDEIFSAIKIPNILSFSDKQRGEYYKRALYWSRFDNIRADVLPLLERICEAQETANEIICQLYIHSYTTVCSQSVKDICNTLLKYKHLCSTNVLPAYMANFWYPVFSSYSDPQYALSLISEIFEEAHVLEVFTDTPSWNEFGYARQYSKYEPKIIQKIMASQTDNILESAKIKFAKYMKQ